MYVRTDMVTLECALFEVMVRGLETLSPRLPLS